ncbi:hypothetical protein [Bacillus cereus]|uniref:hypothetical protein n=1 Tax=Bacillus cereus TaxID=1396 RepID=UPI000BF615F4|nr:hypothetical protein [Bacillus cereus]PFO84725.1 hypothetical protein COJ77_04010 [Bacillus cereus]
MSKIETALDLYALCNFGFTIRSVEKLRDEYGLSWSDIENQTPTLEDIKCNKPAAVSKLLVAFPSVSDAYRANNLFQLAYEGISEKNINLLIEKGITYTDLYSISLEEFNELMRGNKKTFYQKVLNAFDKIEVLKGRIAPSTIENVIIDVVNNLQPNQYTTIDKIRMMLNSKFEVGMSDDGTKVLEKIIKKGLIFERDLRFFKKYKFLNEYLKEEFLNEDVLLMRLEGYSLQEIANQKNISRQAVSYKEKRLLSKMDEDLAEFQLYKKIFENYDWEQNIFCEVYQENALVFNALNLKFKKGHEKIINILSDSKYTFDNRQQNVILQHTNMMMNHMKQPIPLTKSTIFHEVIVTTGQEPSVDEVVTKRCNQFIHQNGLDEKFLFDEVSIRGYSERSDILIRSKGNVYRYFDFSCIDDVIKGKLLSLLNQLAPGVYSMTKIFRENKELMKKIGIRDEYELHNFYKREIETANVIYNRMPEFAVGGIEKNDFLIHLFYEYAPIQIDQLLSEIESEYYLRQDSLKSHISMFLPEYLHGDTIKVARETFTSEQILSLKNVLDKAIYLVDEVAQIGEAIIPNFCEKFLNKSAMKDLGFNLKSEYVFSSEYETVEDCFIKHILEKSYFSKNDKAIYNTNIFKNLLYLLEKSLDVIKVEKDIYITSTNLESADVPKSQLIDFQQKALEYVKSNEYFTLKSLHNRGFRHELETLGFESFFYDRVLWAASDIRTITLSTGYIFLVQETDVALIDFIQWIVQKYDVISLNDLDDYAKEHFGIILDLSRVISLFKPTDMYYSEELNKLYKNKNMYFEEIYNDNNY